MPRGFQIPDFKRDDYPRPNQKWECGLACDGRGCPLGPDARGRCHTTGECKPRRQGDRWQCTRPESHGGTCPDGPLPDGTCCRPLGPCLPRLSLRARRGRWVKLASAFTFGWLLWIFAGGHREKWLDPGPLSSAHALSNTRCSDCHAVMPGEPAATASATLKSFHHATSAQCLHCHELGDSPLSPHGLSQEQLARLTPRPAAATSAASIVPAAFRRSAPVATGPADCHLCHREHQGRAASLTSLTNQQCQVCHQSTFASFAQGHPELGSYPYKRRTRIVFDHTSHLQKHFADPANSAHAPASCLDCHAPAESQGMMLVRGFAQSCAACHEPQIKGAGRAGAKGIAFFRVPGLDVRTLQARGENVGQWPEFAEGPITPFLKLLLATEPAAAADLGACQELDLLDLASATAAQTAAAARTAWRIKSLFFDLTTQGQAALIRRLDAASPAGFTQAQLAQLPGDTLLAAKAAWWPDLFTEVPNHRKGILPAPPVPPKPASTGKPASAPKPAAGDDLLGDDLLSPPAPPPGKRDDLLADDDLLAPDSPAAKKSPDDDLLDTAPLPSADTTSRGTPAGPPAVTMADPEAWVATGGWYRTDDDYTLYYRPGGHADPFMQAWLDAAGSKDTPECQSILRTLANPQAAGLCIKCHSVDSAPQGRQIVQWRSASSSLRSHPATKFSHTAHFSLLNERGCQTCHMLDPPADTAANYSLGAATPGIFRSNFQALAKSTCADCHQSGLAPDSCQLCHNYHQGEFAPGKFPLPAMLVAPAAPAGTPDKS